MHHHLLILASQHLNTQPESNLQRQLGITMTPNEGTVVVVLIIVAILYFGGRMLIRGR